MKSGFSFFLGIYGKIKTHAFQDFVEEVLVKTAEEAIVVVEPAQLAVVLRYDGKENNPPQVMTMGTGPVAQKIENIATANQIPIFVNPSLARGLQKIAMVGSDIPEEFFNSVAELLCQKYRMKSSVFG